MQLARAILAPRSAVVDLGSNSVRLVVFEGTGRAPVVIFNEKAVLRLGRGLQATGRISEEGIAQALTVMRRYHAIVRAMHADPFQVLATAATRDASNGAAFVERLRAVLPDVAIEVVSGEQEGLLSAQGLLCGIPGADGVLADIGGGSLEVVRLAAGQIGPSRTLKLGVIRLAERADNDLLRARQLAETDLAGVAWLAEASGRDLYLVGGAWRAVARVHIARTGYPLAIVNHLAIGREVARALAGDLIATPKRALERLPGASRRRAEDLPWAGLVLGRLLRATGAGRVVFSANGLREGWYMRRVVSAAVRTADPLLSACEDYARQLGRDPTLPPALVAWTDPLFPAEAAEARRLRQAACWLSDIGSHDHPEYRAEQSFFRVLRQPGVGIDHFARAFLATVVAIRYDAEPDAPFLAAIPALVDAASIRHATILGYALRLAYTLSGGTTDLLGATRLRLNHALSLTLVSGTGVFAGESVTRRLERLAAALGVVACSDTQPVAQPPISQAGSKNRSAPPS
jgi:exopolyphosphatase/guanosine-5'-triphosphate,3'-diphosphate pyrophosphatase